MLAFIAFVWLVVLTAWISNINRRVSGGNAINPVVSPEIPKSRKRIEPIVVSPVVGSNKSFEETGSRWVGWLGVLAVLLGLGFFFKYLIDQGFIGEGLRIFIGTVFGVVAVCVGHKIRARHNGFSETIISLGLGVLFVTIYAAQAMYGLISAPIALMILIVISAVGAFLSVAGRSAIPSTVALAGSYLVSLTMPEAFSKGLAIFALGISVSAMFAARHLRAPALGLLVLLGAFLSYGTWITATNPTTLEQLGFSFAFLALFLGSSILRHFGQNGEKETILDAIVLFIGAAGFANEFSEVIELGWPAINSIVILLISILFGSLFVYGRLKAPIGVMMNTAYSLVSVLFLVGFLFTVFSGVMLAISYIVLAVLLAVLSLKINDKNFLVLSILISVLSLTESIGLFARRADDATIIFNSAFIVIVLLIASVWVIAWASNKNSISGVQNNNWKVTAILAVICAHALALSAISMETSLGFSSKIEKLEQRAAIERQISAQKGKIIDTKADISLGRIKSTEGATETGLTALYAAIVLIIGFVRRSVSARVAGLILMFIALARVFLLVWELGSLARILASFTAGIAAICASFLYAKYKKDFLS